MTETHKLQIAISAVRDLVSADQSRQWVNGSWVEAWWPMTYCWTTPGRAVVKHTR